MPPLTIRLHSADNVVVARIDLLPGAEVEGIAVRGPVPAGHKWRQRHRGRRSGAEIRPDPRLCHQDDRPGRACAHAQSGDGRLRARLRVRYRCRPTDYVPESRRDTFEGIVRADGGWRPATISAFCRGSIARPARRALLPISSASAMHWPSSRTSTGWWRSPTAPAAAWPAKARACRSCERTLAGYATPRRISRAC